MPTIITRGGMSAQAYGWASPGNAPLYVEDVFSTYLYTGTGASQTITNGINLSGKGGMVWIKSRSAGTGHFLFDTSRGVNVEINSNTTDANATLANSLTAFNSDGFSISSAAGIGVNAATYASWSFREAPKFFDVVTYTGNGTTQNIAHNLGVAPGMIIVKETSEVRDWVVYHRSLGESARVFLNGTNASTTSSSANVWGNNTTAVAPTSTQFTVGNTAIVNASGQTYVAYLFAHDTTSTGIIQCGSYASSGASVDITLGWEPQLVLVKNTAATGDWIMFDNMRGVPTGGADAVLYPNLVNAEASTADAMTFNATGFTAIKNASYDTDAPGGSYIYIAIRRGPMKTPTLGTSVFSPVARTGTGANATVSAGFVTDLVIEGNRASTTAGTKFGVWDRKRLTKYSISNTTAAEVAAATTIIQANPWDVMDGYKVGTTSTLTNANTITFINWMFSRAPGFFDEVCYTGTGSNQTLSHNLGVIPELMIIKGRSGTTAWQIYSANLSNTEYLVLNTTAARATGTTVWNSTTPSATTFTIGTASEVNTSADTYVAYLFASCPGVSKVGIYTGTGTTATIDCGFSGGARFVMIKRTDTTGDWYVWDSARGIVAGDDPYLLINSTAAEVTNTDYVDADNSGFQISSTAPAAINASGGTFIFLAIA